MLLPLKMINTKITITTDKDTIDVLYQISMLYDFLDDKLEFKLPVKINYLNLVAFKHQLLILKLKPKDKITCSIDINHWQAFNFLLQANSTLDFFNKNPYYHKLTTYFTAQVTQKINQKFNLSVIV